MATKLTDEESLLPFNAQPQQSAQRASPSVLALGFQAWQLIQTLGVIDTSEVLFGAVVFWCAASFILSIVGIVSFLGWVPLLVSLAAWIRVRLLGSLKKQLDRFEEQNNKLANENQKFQEQNRQLSQSITELEKNNREFRDQNTRLSQSISDLDGVRVMIEKHAASTSADLGDILGSIRANIEQQKQIQEEAHRIHQSTLELTSKQELAMMMNLYFQFQNMDGSKDMSAEEFHMFLELVPKSVQQKLLGCAHQQSFDDADADDDGVVSVREVRVWMDRVMQQVQV